MGNALTCASSLRTIGTTQRMQESGMRISTILAVTPTTMWVSGRTTAFSSNLKQEDSGATGMHYPALREIR